MTLRGTLKGHSGWVTQIATTPQYPDMILSASRGEVPPTGSAKMAQVAQPAALVFFTNRFAGVNGTLNKSETFAFAAHTADISVAFLLLEPHLNSLRNQLAKLATTAIR